MADDFTKIAGRLLTGMRDLADWGIGEGHTTAEKLRLTVAARHEVAVKLVEAGHSQREVARMLGVDKRTIGRDVGRNGAKRPTKAERRAQLERELGEFQAELPDRKYGVILADPPWQFEPYSLDTGMDRAADNHYATNTVTVIAACPVADIAAEDCALFLWATAPMLVEALSVMVSWGFTYKSHWMWNKVHIGTGYWNRNQHELLLLGIRGAVPCPAMGEQLPSVFTIARKEHSAKPGAFLEMIEQYFPSLPKIELYRRGPPRPGWDAWGAETEDTEDGRREGTGIAAE